jgi:hypothetical protein
LEFLKIETKIVSSNLQLLIKVNPISGRKLRLKLQRKPKREKKLNYRPLQLKVLQTMKKQFKPS